VLIEIGVLIIKSKRIFLQIVLLFPSFVKNILVQIVPINFNQSLAAGFWFYFGHFAWSFFHMHFLSLTQQNALLWHAQTLQIVSSASAMEPKNGNLLN